MKYKINYSLFAIYIHDGEGDELDEFYSDDKYIIYDTDKMTIKEACDELSKKTLEFFNSLPIRVWYDSLDDAVFDRQNTPYEIYQNCISYLDNTKKHYEIINNSNGRTIKHYSIAQGYIECEILEKYYSSKKYTQVMHF